MTAIDRRMFRYVVPIDDRPHVIDLWGAPVAAAVDCSALGEAVAVEFWAEHARNGLTIDHAYQVFGTGHLLPDGAEWVATCPRTAEGLIFHLYEILRKPVAAEGNHDD